MRIEKFTSEYEANCEISKYLVEKLSKSFTVKKFDRFFDIVVYKEDVLYAIFEIDLSNRSFDDVVKRKKTYDFFRNNKLCRFYILARQNKFDIIEKKDSFYYSVYDNDELIRHLMSDEKDFYYDDNEQIIREVLQENNLSDFAQDIKHSHQAHYCYFDEDTTNRFFCKLLEPKENISTVYRYTSLKALFEMLKSKKYRLNGIVGMNDPTEIDYFEDYVGEDFFNFSHKEKNDIFISSCSALGDDLTMWRLYGDNAKGVCIEFDVQWNDEGFLKQMISYANKNKKDKKLEIVKALIEMNFELKGLEKWKHFFKPYEYSVEQEYRILFEKTFEERDENRSWVITNDNNILNPVYDISLQGKPMNMTKIILGPKCPEKDTNERQIRTLMNELEISGIDVCPSKIKNYR